MAGKEISGGGTSPAGGTQQAGGGSPENQSGGGSGTQQQGAAQSVDSWDALDEQHGSPRHDTPDEPAAEEGETDGDELGDVEADAGDGETGEADDNADPEKKAIEEKAKAKAEQKAGDKKPIKVKTADGKTLDIAPDAVIEVPVDGKPQQVSLAELKKNYSGKVAYEQKFEELAKERKTYEADVQATDEAIGNMIKLVNEGKAVAAVEYLYEILGGDPLKGREQIMSSAREQYEKFAKMSPEERRAVEAEERAAYHEQREKQRTEREAKKKDSQAVSERVTKVISEYGMDKATYAATYEEIVGLKQYEPSQITPELVGQYYRAVQHEEGATKILDSVAPKLENKSKAVTHLRTVWDANPDFTEADVREIAEQVYGKKDARALSRRIQKDAKVTRTPGAGATKGAGKKDEPLFFDDI